MTSKTRSADDEPPLGLKDISNSELYRWLENCCTWLDKEPTAEARAARQHQIRLLWNELDRRGLPTGATDGRNYYKGTRAKL